MVWTVGRLGPLDCTGGEKVDPVGTRPPDGDEVVVPLPPWTEVGRGVGIGAMGVDVLGEGEATGGIGPGVV